MIQSHLRNSVLALAVATAPFTAIASESADSGGNLPTGIGLGAGTFIGAVVAGPLGMLVGGALGGAAGDAVHSRDQRDAIAAEAAATERQLAEARAVNRQLREARAELARKLAEQPPAAAGALAMDVLFATGSDRLSPRAEQRLDALAELLDRYPGLDIALAGHADRRGAAEYNQALSARRAEAVKAALVARNIAAERILVEAVGEHEARAAAGDSDGLAMDRRVAVRLAPGTETGATAALVSAN
jgi:outer membrane protein OmpA-like peptidoglycan-associated protein